MRNKPTMRGALALLLCVCCLCPFLLGMTANASTLGESGGGCVITCTCTVRCTENRKNPDCPGCQDDLTVCIGKRFSCVCSEICTEEKSCEVKCAADAVKADCPVCAADLAACKGKAPEPEPVPVCSCEVKCAAGAVKADCPVCAADLAACKGKAPEPAPVSYTHLTLPTILLV